MSWASLTVIIVIGSGGWVLWRRHRFPGGWAFAFGSEYESDREALATARHRARVLARTAAQEESAARAELAAAEAAYEKRLRELEQRVATLRNPGSGQRLDSRGELTLFQHVLVVETQRGTRSMALAGLDVRFETGQKNYSIYLTEVTGQVYRAKYPHHLPVAEGHQQFDEDDVRDFAVSIANAVAKENSFCARIPQQITAAEKDLEDTRADTSAQDSARERLAGIRERNREDPRRKRADSPLEKALKDWERLTGRVPPR